MAYFCEKTGVRIVEPGVCKAVDPVNGKDEVQVSIEALEPAAPAPVTESEPKAEPALEAEKPSKKK